MENRTNLAELLSQIAPELIIRYENLLSSSEPLTVVNARHDADLKTRKRMNSIASICLFGASLMMVLAAAVTFGLTGDGRTPVASVLCLIAVGCAIAFWKVSLRLNRLGERSSTDNMILWNFQKAVTALHLSPGLVYDEAKVREHLVFLASQVLSAEANLRNACARRANKQLTTYNLLADAYQEEKLRTDFERAFAAARDRFGMVLNKESIYHAAAPAHPLMEE